MTVTRSRLKFQPTGLWRCCVHSVFLWIKENPNESAPDGTQIPCYPEGFRNKMIVKDGVIQRFVQKQPTEAELAAKIRG
jgi:hypothetical protein